MSQIKKIASTFGVCFLVLVIAAFWLGNMKQTTSPTPTVTVTASPKVTHKPTSAPTQQQGNGDAGVLVESISTDTTTIAFCGDGPVYTVSTDRGDFFLKAGMQGMQVGRRYIITTEGGLGFCANVIVSAALVK